MIVHVEVTWEDIENGGNGHSECPLALALARAIPGSRPWVGCNHFSLLEFYGKKHRTPEMMREFILDYDDDFPIKPITFDLEVPDGPLA